MSRRTKPALTRTEAERRATLAWDAYAALCKAQANDPSLIDNPFWRPLKDSAHARFRAIYGSEAMK